MNEQKKNGRGHGRPCTKEPAAASFVARDVETGNQAFTRIAERRVNDILQKLNTLGKLKTSRSKYGYTNEDVEQIRITLVNAVNNTADGLRRTSAKPGFKFVKGIDGLSA